MKTGQYIPMAVLIACLAAPLCAEGEAHPQKLSFQDDDLEGYELVWSDEFDLDGRPDPSKWTFENGFRRNGELQWYQPENAFVEDGRLVIEARRERKPNPSYESKDLPPEFRWRKTIEVTSASVMTKGLHAWTYGRFEVRAKIKAEDGLWPAIWTLGVEGRWPANGEIDIMEYYQDSILANFAWAANHPRQAHWQARKVPLTTLTSATDWDEHFHTWVMEWEKDEITLWLDGQMLNRVDLNKVRNHPKADIPRPFDQPHYLLLNLAVGGTKGGSVQQTEFPSRYEIDYVRVYQRTGASS